MVSVTDQLWDFHAERMWLGACWSSHGRILDDTTISGDDFQHAPHRRLFQAMTDMHTGGAPFDPAGVTRALGEDLTRVKDTLTEVVTCGAIPLSAGWHANVLTGLTARRRMREAGVRVQQAAEGGIADDDDLPEFARAEIDQALGMTATGPMPTWGEHLEQAAERWRTPITDAVPTGWHDLDELLSGGGLRPGHLTVVGARPGIGKSLVATMLAGRAAAGREGGVYFASVEMSAEELTDRIAAAASGTDLRALTNRTLTEQQADGLRAGLLRIRDWPLDLDDRVTTIADIRRGVRNAHRRHGSLRLVLVDYLQLLDAKPAHKSANRQEMVADLSRSLKLLAREHSVPVVMLAQLNRGSAQRADKRPLLTDLRESGAVEQDGDEVLLLHRDDTDPDLAGQIELHLAKNRHGPTGSVRLRWQPWLSRITNPTTIGSVA